MAQHYFCLKPNPNFCFKLIVFLAAACPHCLCFHGTASRAFTIFFVRFVFAIVVLFTVFFVSVRTDTIVHVKLHCDRVCCPRWLLIYLLNLTCFWIVVYLLFKGIIWPGIIIGPVTSNPVLVWGVFQSLYECQSAPHLNPVCLFCGVSLVELWLKFDRASHCQLFEKLGGLCLAYN